VSKTIINGETFWPTHRIYYYDDGTSETFPIDPEEVATTEAANALVIANANAPHECRIALTEAVQLAALSPYPTPEEQAIINAQVSAALALFRALPNPPVDVTALATAVLTLESS
jgi:hypothetical protein